MGYLIWGRTIKRRNEGSDSLRVRYQDYITKNSTKVVLLILNTFVCIALFAAAAYAVLKIAIS